MVIMEQTLLINSGFELKQKDGLPVFVNRNFKRSGNGKEALEKALKEGKRKFTLADTIEVDIEDIVLDLHSLKQIIITPRGKGYISTAFIDFCLEHKVPIYWIDHRGKVTATFTPFHMRKPTMIIKQCRAQDNGKALEISKLLIRLKLESQKMDSYLPKLDKVENTKEILLIEANASRAYFNHWLIGEEWRFNGRHGRKFNDNYYAIDPLNSFLNLGYNLLAQKMSETLLKRGWELSIGFLHLDVKDRYYNQLTYDFIEPYRTWIDESVKTMITDNEIKHTDFVFSKDKKSMVFRNHEVFKLAIDRFLSV
jgi:CRISPR-associated endonuclease Cas1